MKLFSWLTWFQPSHELHDPELKHNMTRADQMEAELDQVAMNRKKTVREIMSSLGKECELDNEFKDLFGLRE